MVLKRYCQDEVERCQLPARVEDDHHVFPFRRRDRRLA